MAGWKDQVFGVAGVLIPIAVAAAISTIPILTVIGVLLSEERRGSAIAYLLGWVLGLFALAGLFSLGLSAAPPAISTPSTPGFGLAATLIGLSLVAFGVALILRRHKSAPASSWIDKISGIGALPAFGVGVILNLRAKAILLAAAAGLAVNESRPNLTQGLIALAIYTAIGSSTVAIPVFLTLANPATMDPRLRRTRDWILPNQRIVTAVVVIMAGTAITGNGITHMAN